ncbi:MAG: hypothetical protein J0L79_01310 [Rickettsiales bacterium]|nr:hypothetical protein [Rickettsiales bacterium]MCA0254007.1 hypothetical protein [Pseudomonadota bacterium]
MLHPSIAIFLSIPLLMAAYKTDKIFAAISILSPIIAACFVFFLPFREVFYFNKIEIIFDGQYINKLISFSLIAVLLCGNLFALSANKKQELVLGSCYMGLAILCALAGDFITLIISLEMMMLISTSIIYISDPENNIKTAANYFITHFISGSLIMAGATFLLFTNKYGFTNLLDAFSFDAKASSYIYMILTGLIINLAAFPFSGWMVNYYKKASYSGFIFLISGTSKVSLLILLKFFAGLGMLKWLGIIVMIYSAFNMLFENNFKSMLSLFSIFVVGFLLIGISLANNELIREIIGYYLAILILYKLILSLCAGIYFEKNNIESCDQVSKIRGPYFIIPLILGLLTMINFPGTALFFFKSTITASLHEQLVYYFILLMPVIALCSLPLKRIIDSKSYNYLELDVFSKSSLLVVTFIILLLQVILINSLKPDLSLLGIILQAAIIGIGCLISIKLKIKRKETQPINVIEIIGKIVLRLINTINYNHKLSNENNEVVTLAEIISSSTKFFAKHHNQKNSIIIVLVIFLILFASTWWQVIR